MNQNINTPHYDSDTQFLRVKSLDLLGSYLPIPQSARRVRIRYNLWRTTRYNIHLLVFELWLQRGPPAKMASQ